MADAANANTLNTALVQLPAIIIAFGGLIAAGAAAWKSLTDKMEIATKKVEDVHLAINSRLDEWKNETREAAVAAAIAAHAAGYAAAKAELDTKK